MQPTSLLPTRLPFTYLRLETRSRRWMLEPSIGLLSILALKITFEVPRSPLIQRSWFNPGGVYLVPELRGMLFRLSVCCSVFSMNCAFL